MRSERHGMTLLELIMAMVVMFVAASMLMPLFLSGVRHFHRAKDLSTCTFLAQSSLEPLLVTPLGKIRPGAGTFASPFTGYKSSVSVSDFDVDFKVLQVTVTSTSGALATLSTLRKLVAFYGVATEPATHLIDFSQYPQSHTVEFNDVNSTGTSLPPMPDQGRPGGVAGAPDAAVVWAADTARGGICFLDKLASPRAWSAPLATAGLGSMTGLAVDANLNYVFVGDSDNRALWVYHDSVPRRGTWTGPLKPEPPFSASHPPLGTPVGVACDAFGSTVWVADADNNCLRQYLALSGAWDETRYTTSGLVAPQGVALTPGGEFVYTITQTRLYRYDTGARQWTTFSLPQALSAAGPSGLAVSAIDSVLFVNARRGELWKVDLGSASFSRRYP